MAAWVYFIPLVTFAVAYGVNWRVQYHSDFALMGLLAQRVLEGQQFIFVPQVGYQGLLFEANWVALFFRLLGAHPISLHLAAVLVFLIMAVVFYFSVREWEGAAVARRALLLLGFASPLFYGVAARTQPNYGETFAFGSALIFIYGVLRRTQGVWAQKLKPTYLGLAALAGFLVGWGIYTYGQMLYFLGAVVLHALWPWWVGPRFRWVYLRRITLGVMSFGFLSWVSGIERGTVGARLVKWDAFETIKISGACWVMLRIAEAAWSWLKEEWQCRRVALINKGKILAVAAGFAVLGISPKLYYFGVLKGKTVQPLQTGGELGDVLNRAAFWVQGQAMTLGYQEPWTLNAFLKGGAVTLLLILTLPIFLRFFKEWKLEVGPRTPWAALLPVVSLAFLTSNAVRDLWSVRYSVVLIFFWVIEMARSWEQGRARKWISAWTVFMLVGLGWDHLTPTRKYHLDEVREYLKREKTTIGYAGYWYGYVLNFLEPKEFWLEPVGSNYVPGGIERVQGAEDRGTSLVYVDSPPFQTSVPWPPLGKNLLIHNRWYRVAKQHSIQVTPDETVWVFRLEGKKK